LYKNKHDVFQFFHAHHPLVDENTTVEIIFETWNKQLLTELEQLYEKRNVNDAFIPMCKGIILFFYALFLTNDQTIDSFQIENWKEALANFNILPVNINDRINFIIEHPTQYHSFVQLKLLYTELMKKHAIKKRGWDISSFR